MDGALLGDLTLLLVIMTFSYDNGTRYALLVSRKAMLIFAMAMPLIRSRNAYSGGF